MRGVSDDQLGELADEIVDFCRIRVPFEGGRWVWWKLPMQLRAAATTRPQARDLEDRYKNATGVSARRALGDVEYAIRLTLAAFAAGLDEQAVVAGCRTLLGLFARNVDGDEGLVALETAVDSARRPTDQFTTAWRGLAGRGRS